MAAPAYGLLQEDSDSDEEFKGLLTPEMKQKQKEKIVRRVKILVCKYIFK